MTHTTKVQLLLLLSLSAIVAMYFVQPIAQSSAYHQFADARMMMRIPNYWNVLSNLPFLLFGGMGIKLIFQQKKIALWQNRLFFFVGIFITGFGSAYYHWNPCVDTLLWDRLPMVIAFMSFFTLIIGEYIKEEWGEKLLFPMLLLGIASVFYWYWTETNNAGDLRAYALVQFLPLILIPIMTFLFERKLGNTSIYWKLIAIYALAKIFETFDAEVFVYFPISGHSLKHFTGSLAAFFLWKNLKKQEINN
jgi:hypothetical protein